VLTSLRIPYSIFHTQFLCPAPETTTRKFVQGIPSLYSRAPKNQPTVASSAAAAAPPHSTVERLLAAAQDRAADAPRTAERSAALAASPAEGSVQEQQQRRQQESALQARLRAMGYNSFSGDGSSADDGQDDAELSGEHASQSALAQVCRR
jgi:hypothetical protein